MTPSVVPEGSAKEGCTGPPVGLIDVGISEDAYLLQLAIPGLQKYDGNFKLDMEVDGKICVEGIVSEAVMVQYFPLVHQNIKAQQLCLPGPFTISFTLPGPVDPRLTDVAFRLNGTVEVIVMKQKMGSAKVCCTGPPMGNPADLPETKPSVVLVGSAKECCTGTPVGNPADLPEMKPSVFVVGSAKEACNVPSIGVVDIGVSEDAYLFRVALPGIRNDQSTFKCDIEFDGKVCIHGVVTKSAMQQYFPAGHQMKIQQLCQPGPFSISFTLPGPVNPHLTDLDFRPDGILEVVVIKYKYGKCSTHSEAFSVDGM
ncbi:hypothetical protein ACOSQ2_025217 [Xanthoceras sorbifolium]